MIQLIVTANDNLYDRLLAKLDDNTATAIRAANVLDAFKLALQSTVDQVVIDMSLHAADTLLETIHTRPETSHIPVYIVKSGGAIPLELRRLCTDVLEAHTL